jgi:hypothetical protein
MQLSSTDVYSSVLSMLLRAGASSECNNDPRLAHSMRERVALVDEILVWKSKDLHNTGKLFLFVFARKDKKSGVELG